jgi:hypothetical protein
MSCCVMPISMIPFGKIVSATRPPRPGLLPFTERLMRYVDTVS